MKCTSCGTSHPDTYSGFHDVRCFGNARCVHYAGVAPVEPMTVEAELAAQLAFRTTSFDASVSDYRWAQHIEQARRHVSRGEREYAALVVDAALRSGATREQIADIEQRLHEGRAARERFRASTKAAADAVDWDDPKNKPPNVRVPTRCAAVPMDAKPERVAEAACDLRGDEWVVLADLMADGKRIGASAANEHRVAWVRTSRGFAVGERVRWCDAHSRWCPVPIALRKGDAT